MPEVDFALICDFVRAERGVAHIIGGGFDTITAQQVPTGSNLGFVMRMALERVECERPHRVELVLSDTDGARVFETTTIVNYPWIATTPAGWPTHVMWGLNIGLVFPRFGPYVLDVVINDTLKKQIQLQVVQAGAAAENPG